MPPAGVAWDRVETFTVTAPVNTFPAAPLEVATGFTPGKAVGVDLRIPPGHKGLTGIAIALAHQPIHPEAPGTFITDDGVLLEMPLDDPVMSGQWSAFVFNSSRQSHSWLLRYYIVSLGNVGRNDTPAVYPLTL